MSKELQSIKFPGLDEIYTVPSKSKDIDPLAQEVTNLKDTIGNLTNVMNFIGTSTTDPKVSGATVAGHTLWEKGDVVLYGGKEFVLTNYVNSADNWHELGDEGSHALKSVTITGDDGLTGGGSLANDQVIKHAVPTGASAGSTTSNAQTPSHGGSFNIPVVTTDKFGHVTGKSTATVTLPTYSEATTSTNGLMAAADKIKLNNLPDNIKSGDGEDSLVINEGDANGKYAIAGGSTDKSMITDLVGTAAGLLTSVSAPVADGNASLAFGASTVAHATGSMALGAESHAGCLGYYFWDIDFTNKKITLSTNQKAILTSRKAPSNLAWAVNDVISIVNNEPYPMSCKITAVDKTNGIITVDTLPFTSIDDPTIKKPNDRFIYVAAKPASGEVKMGFGALAIGYQSKALGPVSTAIGYQNTALDTASFVTGRENTGAWGSLVGGYQNEVLNNTGFAAGRMNTVTGSNSAALGRENTASGFASFATGQGTTASGSYSSTEGYGTAVYGNFGHAEGQRTVVGAEGEDGSTVGSGAHAEGFQSTARGAQSHAEGNTTTAYGAQSHAEGNKTTAYGDHSHTEGLAGGQFDLTQLTGTTSAENKAIIKQLKETVNSGVRGEVPTIAFGSYSHAEGRFAATVGYGSHAEGARTMAYGNLSHAEGHATFANGDESHAEGHYTTANGKYQHVQGKYNVEDNSEEYAHIVGNGTSNSKRSNAHTLDWDGNAWFKGNVYIGGTKESEGTKVATNTDVTNSANTTLTSAKSYTDAEINKWVGDSTVSAQISSAINAVSADLTNDIQSATAKLDTNKADTIQSKSGSFITTNNSAYTPVKGLNIYGKTTQFTTTGKNLLGRDVLSDAAGSTTTDGDVITTEFINGAIHLRGDISYPAGTYTFSVVPVTSDVKFEIYLYRTSDGTTLGHSGSLNWASGATWTFTASEEFTFNIAGDYQNKGTYSYKLQLEAGSTATAYESYTGGKPSPNPDYPQELVSAGDDGSIGVKVLGKNLLGFYDFEPITPTYRTYSCNNGVISVKFNTALSTTSILQNVALAYLNNDQFGCGTYVFSITYEGGSPKYPSPRVQITMDDGSVVEGHHGVPFTLTQSGKITGILCDAISPASGTVYAFRLQIEQGTAQTDWEQPVTAQTLTLPAPNGLPGIPVDSGGNYTDSNGQQWVCDEIDLARGVYVQRITTDIFDGTESWEVVSSGASLRVRTYNVKTNYDGSGYVSCSHFQEGDTAPGVYLGSNSVPSFFVSFTSLAEWTSYLAQQYTDGNPVTIQGIRQKPIEMPLDADILAAYATLHTNNPNTTVMNDAGADMTVKYYTPSTAVQMVHTPEDEGKVLTVDEHGCVVLGELPDTTTVGVTQTLTSGTEIGAITVNGETTKLYAPASAQGGEDNQNAFSNIKVGSTTIQADSTTDTFELVGSNITLTPDATNDKITIGLPVAGATLGGIKSGGDITVASDGTVSVNNDSHEHTGLSSPWLETSILEKAVSDSIGFHVYQLAGSSYAGNDLPDSTYCYGTAIVNKRNIYIQVSLHYVNKPVQYNGYNGASWTGWTTDIDGLTIANVDGLQSALDGKASTAVATTQTNGLMSASDKLKFNQMSLQAGTDLGCVKSGGDVTISKGIITVNDDSHNHTIANVDGLQGELNSKASTAVATVVSNGLMSADDKNRLIRNTHATFGGYDCDGYIKIKINSGCQWMLDFILRVYSSYRAVDIQISGYNYGNDNWYSPRAITISDTHPEYTVDITFGYDDDGLLWIATPAGNYTGAGIFNVVNGFAQIPADEWENLFTITRVSELTGTIQSTSNKTMLADTTRSGLMGVYDKIRLDRVSANLNGLNTSVLDFANQVEAGVYNVHLNGSAYTGNDLPNANCMYGTATIVKRNATTITVYLNAVGASTTDSGLYYNMGNGSSWYGWIEVGKGSNSARIIELPYDNQTWDTPNGNVGYTNVPFEEIRTALKNGELVVLHTGYNDDEEGMDKYYYPSNYCSGDYYDESTELIFLAAPDIYSNYMYQYRITIYNEDGCVNIAEVSSTFKSLKGTTYTLTKSGTDIILTGSDGSQTSVTDSTGSSGTSGTNRIVSSALSVTSYTLPDARFWLVTVQSSEDLVGDTETFVLDWYGLYQAYTNGKTNITRPVFSYNENDSSYEMTGSYSLYVSSYNSSTQRFTIATSGVFPVGNYTSTEQPKIIRVCSYS